MGFSHSWIAVRGLSRETALAELGFEVAEELSPGDLPSLGMGELPGGWLIVVSDDVEAAFKAPLADLARHGSAVACLEEEHVMVSEACGYEDGAQIWRVFHDPNRGVEHLQLEGALPAEAAPIEAELRAEQAGQDLVDYIFDVGPRIAQSVCGYRLCDPEPEGFVWTLLSRPMGKGFFARLFGR